MTTPWYEPGFPENTTCDGCLGSPLPFLIVVVMAFLLWLGCWGYVLLNEWLDNKGDRP